MATLSPHHKEFIVKQLACFETPSNVIEKLNENYGVEISSSQVAFYNPENRQADRLADKWRELFYETREKFIEGAIDIPIAHKMYRLQQLQENYEKLKRMGNIVAANQVLEQAAKEIGGAYEDIRGKLDELADQGKVNFYQRINQKILSLDLRKN